MWTKEEVSTSVEASRGGPLLIAQMQGTARTFMVAQLETIGAVFSTNNLTTYNGCMLDATGLQH
eukprot:9045243-Prorocentrum_lima.AAC.1